MNDNRTTRNSRDRNRNGYGSSGIHITADSERITVRLAATQNGCERLRLVKEAIIDRIDPDNSRRIGIVSGNELIGCWFCEVFFVPDKTLTIATDTNIQVCCRVCIGEWVMYRVGKLLNLTNDRRIRIWRVGIGTILMNDQCSVLPDDRRTLCAGNHIMWNTIDGDAGYQMAGFDRSAVIGHDVALNRRGLNTGRFMIVQILTRNSKVT